MRFDRLAFRTGLVAAVAVAAVARGARRADADPPPDGPAGRVSGYWEGKGAIWEKKIDDAWRKLTRRSDTEFWFVVDKDGRATGEATTTYSAELQAIKWSIALPAGSIEASVEGTSEKKKVTYPIEGTVTRESMVLRATGEADGNVPGVAFDFVISANVTIPLGVGGAAAGAPQLMSIKVPAKGWSPFQDLQPAITKRPHGPLVASAKRVGEKFSVEWQATKNPTYDLDELADLLDPILEPRLEVEIKAKLKAELKAEIKEELKQELKAEIEAELRARLKAEIEAELKAQLLVEIKAQLKAELKAELIAELKAQLKLEIEAELEAKIAAEVTAKIEAELKVKIEAELKAELLVEIRAELDALIVEVVADRVPPVVVEKLQPIVTELKAIEDHLHELEAASLTVKVVDRTTGQPIGFATVEVVGTRGKAAALPAPKDGIWALRLGKGHYTVNARADGRTGTQSVDLATDQSVTISL